MKIFLVKLGHPQVNIHRVISVLNNNQQIYELSYIQQIANVGKADLDGLAL